MADNVELDPGSGGAVIKTDDDGTAQWPYSKTAFGADGTRTRVTSSAGLPVKVIEGVTPGIGASNLGKAEDAGHSSGDVGVMALGVRKDAPVALAADGDYIPLITSPEGALWTEHIPNEVDSGNSSTSTLNAAATFTGTGVDILSHDIVTVTIDSSHDSSTDGMTFQFSTDNTNWDDVYLFTYIAADGARRFQFPVTSQFFRVVYTNGGTNQTHFRLQTILHHNNSLTSIHRIKDDVGADRSAQIMKTAIIAQKAGSGDFVPVQSTAGGNLKTSTQEISDGLDIGAGNAGSETQRVSISTDDVNLSAIKASIAGPAGPSIDSYTHAAINLTTGNDQVLASSAANKQIWVYGYGFTCGDADGQTVSLQDEDNVAITGIMEFAQYGGISVAPSGNFSMPLFKLGTDKDLEVDITGGDVDGWIAYAIVSV